MKNLIFASLWMFVFVFCSCNSQTETRTEKLSNYAKEFHLTNERLNCYASGIVKQDSVIQILKDEILNSKASSDHRKASLEDYQRRLKAKVPLEIRINELITQKSRIQTAINEINPTYDELIAYGLQNYLN